MRTTAILITCVVFGAGVVTGCSDTPSPAPPPPTTNGMTATSSTTTTPPADIVISNFAYTVRAPLKPGQKVTVINEDEANHSLTADANDAFDIRISGGGGIKTFTAPMTPGTYDFHCKYHANMHGSLTVQ